MRTFPAILFLVIIAAYALGQNSPLLPAPAGPFKVGRTLLNWVDGTRDEVMTEVPNDHRELLVYIWYPARESRNMPSAYMPGVERLVGTPVVGTLSNLFGPAWTAIQSRELQT
ncbi:MAG TPA: hypothetical protein VK210_11565, partial [Terriglobia bacterium]|nr:hypothetical protein [Terriglobia bacterium]